MMRTWYNEHASKYMTGRSSEERKASHNEREEIHHPPPQDIKAIVDEAIRKANLNSRRELSASELDKVNAGTMIVPDTHEEIDQNMNILQGILDAYGPDVALIAAQEMQLVPGTNGSGSTNPFSGGSVDQVRNWMHRRLDNIKAGIKEDYVTIY